MSGLKHISVGKDGTVWGADDLNRLWRRSGSSWTKDQTAIGHLVAVRDAQQVWCVNDQGETFRLDQQGKWQKDNLAKDVRTISAASDGTIWCGNTAGKLFRREGNTWIESPGAIATVVAVGGKDHVWCLNAEGEVFQLDNHGKWQKDSGASGAKTISVGADGTVWYGKTDDTIFRREGDAWHSVDGRATVLAVGSKDNVWCVNSDGDAFHRTSQGTWQKVDQPKGSWEYKVKQNDGLYSIVRQQYNLRDEKEVQRIAGLVSAENHIKNQDWIAADTVLKLQTY